MSESANVTGLLRAWSKGDREAFDRLAPFVYQELRRLARGYLAGEAQGHTLQATALVNEAFLRLVDSDIDYNDRKHFFVVAARMMRRVLVDHARARNSDKRGSGRLAITIIDDKHLAGDDGQMPIVLLDDALERLAQSDPRMASAVELIYFGGLSFDDAAGVLGVATSTVYEDVRFARAWLKVNMS